MMRVMATKTPESPKPIHVFRAGKHVTRHGETLEFSESDIAAIAAAYDPALHEAPFVVGHPKTDAPAYGWGLRFTASGPDLFAVGHQINPEFAELVNSGAFKKRSLKLYRPNDPVNPKPGAWYPQHVGFLGANPPAVKGLKPVELSEDENLVEVEFGEWEDRTIAALFRRLREWFIGAHGQETADRVIPGDDVDALVEDAARETAPALPSPAFSEQSHHQEETVTPEEAARIEAENAALKAQVAESKAREKAAQDAARKVGAVEFCEGLIAAGKLLPAEKDSAVGLLLMASASAPVEFGEGNDAVTETPLPRLQALLSELPKRVEFGEVAKAGGEGKPVEFAAPSGMGVDAERLDVHAKALAYQAAHPGTDYIAAVRAVS